LQVKQDSDSRFALFFDLISYVGCAGGELLSFHRLRGAGGDKGVRPSPPATLSIGLQSPPVRSAASSRYLLDILWISPLQLASMIHSALMAKSEQGVRFARAVSRRANPVLQFFLNELTRALLQAAWLDLVGEALQSFV